MHNHIRLFVAAPLPKNLKHQLQQLAGRYKHPAIRFVPEENLHLTLFFLGNTQPDRLPETEHALAEIATGTAPFELKLAAIEPGPKPRHPRLIWARFEEHAAFTALSRQTTRLLAQNPEQALKPIPHVTLARFRKDIVVPYLPVAAPGEAIRLAVTEIALWQSELGQPHPTYSILSRFALTAG